MSVVPPELAPSTSTWSPSASYHPSPIPIPQIHYWFFNSNNILSRSFVITDSICGKNPAELWNHRDWITDLKYENIFEQIAGWITELAAFKFDQIGRLDWDDTSGTRRVVPFSEASAKEAQRSEERDTTVPDGPFDTAHSYLTFLLSNQGRTSTFPMPALFQPYIYTLPDRTLDGPSFVLFPSDLDSQNVLVDDDGTITGTLTGRMYTLVPARQRRRGILCG